MLETARTVAQITRYISQLFSTDDVLQDIWITGEVSNMTRAKSGHWYFTIKDSDAALKCVMWRSSAERQTVVPAEGDAIEVHGKVGVYEPRGEYQLYADAIRPVGVGSLYQAFERLKARLQSEGLFDADRKRDIPHFPYKIGVVTSPTAAAFQDILNVLGRRFPLAEVVLSPTIVQGKDAPPQIVQAIERLTDASDVDVIIIARGGGSIEDLWAFNDEAVARAVVASRIPVVSGVGHETDFTIVDFVSDIRAPTPSAAAEIATPDVGEMAQGVIDRDALMTALLDDRIASHRSELTSAERSLRFSSPEAAIRNNRQRVDDFNARLLKSTHNRLSLLRERFEARGRALAAADPQAILKRGYAVVTRSDDGRRVVSELDVQPGVGITLQLRDGEVKARVEDKDTHGRYKRTLL